MDKISDLKSSVNIVDVVQNSANINLKKRGVEWVGLCPFHHDKKASLNVNEKKQVFFCGPCGHNGDVIDFLSLIYQGKGNGESEAFKQALDYLKNQTGNISSQVKKIHTNKKKAKIWTNLPFGPQPGQINHYRHGKPNSLWKYIDANGKLAGYVCRFDLPDGGKEVLPFCYCTDGKKKEWRWKAFGRPRPLYNADLLAKYPNKTVLIVEGEKTADAAQKLLPHIVVTTWPGGSNAIGFANWEVLKGRNVVFWPDNDKYQRYGENHKNAGKLKPYHEQSGNEAMMAINAILSQICPVTKWIMNSPTFPNKWDIADAKGWTTDKTKEYIRANIVTVPEPGEVVLVDDEDQKIPEIAQTAKPVEQKPKELEQNPTLPADQPGAATDTPPQVPAEYKPDNEDQNESVPHFGYFSFLGYEKTEDSVLHCFYVKETQTVQKFSGAHLNRIASLIGLAPLDFWESMFTHGRSNKVRTEMALNWLVRSSQSRGFFSSDKLRGRGAWIDRTDVVFHAGDHLVVNNKRVALGDHKSRYIYEAGAPLGYDISSPLKTAESNQLVELCKAMNWSREINAYLLAGWCVIAPVCGAMKWRSHIWITGGAGSGKSWLLKEVVRFLLGGTVLAVQAETTEPGLRQLIKADALPVVFDEADAEDFQQQQSIKKVLGLMRAASADDGGYLVKGSSGGNEKKYRIRSCFAFASIGVTATQQSDRTRITLLSLVNLPDGPEKEEKWFKLQRLHAELLTDEFALNLQARTISILPTILKNAVTFSKAAAAVLGKQRIGDQIGSLLAGAYSLSSRSLISYDDAIEWINKRDWDEERQLEETRDENRLLSHLMERLTRMDRQVGPGLERTIGELMSIAINHGPDEAVSPTDAEGRLNRLGFKIYTKKAEKEGGERRVYFAISNSSGHIKKFLWKTPWTNNWAKILARLDGAIHIDPTRFAVGHTSRAVGVPMDFLLGIKKKEDLPF